MTPENDYREILSKREWKHPSDYGGFSPDGDYMILSRHRDSYMLDESNWDIARSRLGCEPYDEGRDPETYPSRPASYDWRAGHWAVGWVEYLMVRRDAPESVLIAAADIVCDLENYPILDESDYSQRQFEAVQEYWRAAGFRERMELCKDNGASIFAARHEWPPESVECHLYDSEIAY